nr:PREDICTED: LOW QUALITY PROTEIN: TNFAIP3-interacting protein 2 [Opisthocomus hoazin]
MAGEQSRPTLVVLDCTVAGERSRPTLVVLGCTVAGERSHPMLVVLDCAVAGEQSRPTLVVLGRLRHGRSLHICCGQHRRFRPKQLRASPLALMKNWKGSIKPVPVSRLTLASRASLTPGEQCSRRFCYQYPLLFEDIKHKPFLTKSGPVYCMEVQKLNQQLEEKNGEIHQMINQLLCRSLTDETHQLQRKLASTAEMCQHLAKCLEEKQRKEKGNSDDQIPTERRNQLLDNETSLQALICNLQDENRMLKQKVAHVEDLNAKWQKYDASRDEYVKRLHLQLKEMKSQLEQQHGVASAQTNSDLMHKEIFRLNKLLEEKMNECIKTKRELEDVKKASEGDNERMQMLEQQMLVYKDDFTSERSDRERAQSKIQELQAEVACLQHQLARRQDSRETSSHFRVHMGNQNHMYVQTNVEHLRGNSPGQTDTRRTSSQSEQASPPADNGNSGSEGRAQGELRCPHCMRFFNDELSDEFLKHVAECCQ